MPLYEAEIDFIGHGDEYIEGLRAFGHPRIVYRIEAKNKSEAVQLTIDALDSAGHWSWNRDHAFWEKNLKAMRGKRLAAYLARFGWDRKD